MPHINHFKKISSAKMMANIAQQIFFKRSQLIIKNIDTASVCMTQVRTKTNRKEKPPKPLPNVQMGAMAQSLVQKGYLRAQNPYTPPKNVSKIVEKLKSDSAITSGAKGSKFTLDDKFQFLSLCAKEFGRTVPNSTLHEINTFDEVIQFYETPINPFLPLDELSKRKLPPNLHIEHEYTRFNPATDTKFGGHSAFPTSSTIVTGLKYRKKYAGYEAKHKHLY